jgi:hypothetical protein
MPDLSICVKADNGEIYCWDRTREKFVKAVLEDVPTAKVPPEVIESFIKSVAKASA